MGFYDSQLGLDCVVGTTSDGQSRCVPSWGSGINLFPNGYGDPICTQRLLYRQVECTEDPPQYVPQSVAPCWYSVEIYQVGPVFTGTVYVLSGSNCAPLSLPSYTFFEATLVDPSIFQQMTEHVEP
jgi:hypothetical protein